MRKVCIDCGYGMGYGVSTEMNTIEGNNNLIIGERVAKKLSELRFAVSMTRNNNEYITLEERLKRIEDSKAKIAISIDVNWSQNPNQKGVETYYGKTSKTGDLLAKRVQKELIIATQLYNRGFLCSSDKNYKGIFFLTNSKVVTVITLIGFYSNTYERELRLQEKFKERVSMAVAEGICKYFDINIKPHKIAK